MADSLTTMMVRIVSVVAIVAGLLLLPLAPASINALVEAATRGDPVLTVLVGIIILLTDTMTGTVATILIALGLYGIRGSYTEAW